jgi:hypothetical protein
MTDHLHSPAYSTSVGLLKWATMMSEVSPAGVSSARRSTVMRSSSGFDWEKVRNWLQRLLP